MPFQSESQRRLMWLKHPQIARKWAKEYPNQGKLPMHKKSYSKEAVAKARQLTKKS